MNQYDVKAVEELLSRTPMTWPERVFAGRFLDELHELFDEKPEPEATQEPTPETQTNPEPETEPKKVEPLRPGPLQGYC